MTGYNPKDAEGFINFFALPITVPPRGFQRRKSDDDSSRRSKNVGRAIRTRPRRVFLRVRAFVAVSTGDCCRRNSLSIVHGRGAIAAAGILTADEGQQIVAALDEIEDARANRTTRGSTIRRPKTFIILRKRR